MGSSQPNWGTALDKSPHTWSDAAPLRQESQGNSIPKFLQDTPAGGFGAGLCQGTLRVPHTDHWRCFQQDTSARAHPGVTQSPRWDPALGSLCTSWANRGKSQTQLFSSFSLPKGCVPGWTPADTRVGSLRSSRSWECYSLVVWMQMTLKLSLSSSQNDGSALGPRDLNEALG